MSVKYRSLFITSRRNDWYWGELYHSMSSPTIDFCTDKRLVPRELDFQLLPRSPRDPYTDIPPENGLELKIPTAFTTDYISNHVDRVDEPSTAPCFSYCENRLCSVTLDIECLPDAQDLMKALTVKWQIKAVRAHVSISLEASKSSSLSLFPRRSHEKHEQAELSIWERSTSTETATSGTDILERRALVRWSSPSSKEKTWLTASVLVPNYISSVGHFPSMHSHDKPVNSFMGSEKTLLQVKDVVRGKLIDVVDMRAVAGKSKPPSQSPKSSAGSGVAALKVRFISARDKEDFAREAGLML